MPANFCWNIVGRKNEIQQKNQGMGFEGAKIQIPPLFAFLDKGKSVGIAALLRKTLVGYPLEKFQGRKQNQLPFVHPVLSL